MTVYRRQEDGSVVVATFASFASADLIRTTLAANGFRAVVRARSVVYPSIDAVEGADVSVAESDADAVLKLLRALQMPEDRVE
ncbi:MAG: hypothetical protein E6G04_00105 [Actinobacteria bacterium]|nr:MAG: hypothetical protein E6G04_00105 [Actinomycetota bacterium]